MKHYIEAILYGVLCGFAVYGALHFIGWLLEMTYQRAMWLLTGAGLPWSEAHAIAATFAEVVK